MRLRTIQWILGASVPELNYQESKRRGAEGQIYVTVASVNKMRIALERLAEVDAFATEAKSALRSVVFASQYDSVDVLESDSQSTKRAIERLAKRAQLVKQTIDQVLPVEEAASFSVSIPIEQGMTIDSLERELASIREIFEQPLRRIAKADMFIVGADSGSIVLDIATTAQALASLLDADAAKAIAGLRVVSVLYEKSKDFLLFRQELKQRDEQVRKLGLENDILELDRKVKEAETAAKLKQLQADIAEEFPEASDENFVLVMSKSVRKLAEKLEQGYVIRLAANTPEAIAERAAPEMLAPDGVLRPTPDPQLLKDVPQLSPSESSSESKDPGGES